LEGKRMYFEKYPCPPPAWGDDFFHGFPLEKGEWIDKKFLIPNYYMLKRIINSILRLKMKLICL